MGDQELIKGCLSADRRCQEELYIRFSPKMYAVCYRYAGNQNDAEDLLQEGFMRVFRYLEKYRGDGSFEGWIRRIFVNTAIEYYRKKANLYAVSDHHLPQLQASDISAVELLKAEDVLGMVARLASGYRTVFNLFVVEGYSHKEIAEMLGITEGTSKSQLARARYLLQEQIEKRELKQNEFKSA
jgi:RNA polymerase sigma-70 factor (ECF subfamily)